MLQMLYNVIQCYTMLYNVIQCYTMLYNVTSILHKNASNGEQKNHIYWTLTVLLKLKLNRMLVKIFDYLCKAGNGMMGNIFWIRY